jgi:hypothetical protein
MSLSGLPYVARVVLVTLVAAIIPIAGYLYIGSSRLERFGIPKILWPVVILLPAIVTFVIAVIVYK